MQLARLNHARDNSESSSVALAYNFEAAKQSPSLAKSFACYRISLATCARTSNPPIKLPQKATTADNKNQEIEKD